jgi:2-polyprenyl-3-methyl-5-hydroxy-6-metoxy-1,4-benzoquinol methylase
VPPGVRTLAAHGFERAIGDNLQNIAELMEPTAGPLLDVGCDDGEHTRMFAGSAGAAEVHGIELVDERAELARAKGIDVTSADLNEGLPYEDGQFAAIVSNQVIEHLADTDVFVAEIARVLEPGGYAVVSTENLASWHNVFALVFGWQPFSLTNVSGTTMGLGNPLAVHRGEEWEYHSSWQHRRVFAYRGLVELFEAHGLVVENVRGAGYYPLPRRIARLDPRHAAFLTVKARKPRSA